MSKRSISKIEAAFEIVSLRREGKLESARKLQTQLIEEMRNDIDSGVYRRDISISNGLKEADSKEERPKGYIPG